MFVCIILIILGGNEISFYYASMTEKDLRQQNLVIVHDLTSKISKVSDTHNNQICC